MTTVGSDLTASVIGKMLDAMPHPSYEVGLLDMANERMYLRHWDRATLERSIGYLKQQNRQGRHIYIRPHGPHPYTLLDDLDAAKLASLRKAGFDPAVVVETSPGNFQAWLKHDRTLPPELSTKVSQHLARSFGADPGSADWRHLGRLAGFTNRKDKYQQANGHFPFVRLIAATGHAAEPLPATVALVAADLARQKAEEAERRMAYRPTSSRHSDATTKTIADFRNSPTYGGDGHRADLAYATYALSRGVDVADIEHAIRSRDLSHKGGANRQTEYVVRTIDKAKLAVERGPSRG